MSRFEILDEMIDNWQGRLDQSRIAMIEKKTRYATEEELRLAVGIAIDTLRYPPIVKDMHAAIAQAKTKLALSKRGQSRARFKPGDVVGGQQTFTPLEAVGEIERLKDEYPAAFESRDQFPKLDTPEGRRADLELLVTRMCVSALRRCASRDPNKQIVVPTQHDLF